MPLVALVVLGGCGAVLSDPQPLIKHPMMAPELGWVVYEKEIGDAA